jgi:acetyl esterase/lipase
MIPHLSAILCPLVALTTIHPPPPGTPVEPLYQGAAPESHGAAPIDTPTLTEFIPKNAGHPTPAVVIFPGGGYVKLSMDTEGYNEAAWFQKRGVAAFVLKYRLPGDGYLHPVPLHDAQRAIRLVRAHAAKWNINPDKIGIMGFSAGGHLAATAETHYDSGNPAAPDPIDRAGCRPDFSVLVYAVVSLNDKFTNAATKLKLLGPHPDPKLVESLSNETQVTPQTPPTILVEAKDDNRVPIINSHLMYEALKKNGVPAQLDEYPTGSHGFGYGHVPDKSPKGWLEHVGAWLKNQGFMS